MHEILTSATVWFLLAVVILPFLITAAIEIIYRKNHDEALEYEYEYKDSDFDDGLDNSDYSNWKLAEDIAEISEDSDPG